MQFARYTKAPARSTRRAVRWSAAAVLLMLAGGATAAEAQQLRYSLTPAVQRVWWDDNLGLTDTYMHGGRLGITFGEYIGLQGYYMMRDGVATNLEATGLTGFEGAALVDQELDIDTYGADIMVRFGAGGLNPFVRFGGGVLRFDPQVGERSSHVVLRGGGGIRIGQPGSIQVQLSAENMMFRANRFRFADMELENGVPADPELDDLRHNLVVGAGLTIPFGGTIWADDTPQWGWSDVGLPIEVFAGRLDFADEVGLARQDLVGLRTGINFGRAVGLRGYYWRGVESGFDSLDPIQSWGGEAQFSLAQGTGLLPYLLVGAGQLQFRDDFLDPAGEPRDNRTMLILGGGLGLDLAPGLRLNLSARDYIFSQDDVEDVTRTDQLFNNWMYSAGLSFTIGGARRGMPPARVMERDPQVETVIVDSRTGEVVRTIPRRITEEERRRMVRDTEHTVERQRLDRRDDRDRVDRDMEPRDLDRRDMDRRLRADEEYLEERRRLLDERREMDRRMLTERELERQRLAPTGRDTGYVSDRVIQVPVPTEGEIRLRYGPVRDTGDTSIDARIGRMLDERGIMRHGPAQQLEGQMPQQYMSPPMHGAMGAEMREAVRSVLREELDRERYYMQPGQQAAPRAQAPAPAARVPARPGAPAAGVQKDPQMMEDDIVNRVSAMIRAERDTVRVIVREEMRRVGFDDERERRLIERIDRTVEERTRALAPRPEPQPAPAPMETEPAPAPQPAEPRTWSVYSGLSFGGGTQIMLGGRADLGPVSSQFRNIQLVPELAFGLLGGARSTLIAAHGQYRLGNLQLPALGPSRPHVGLGLGLLHYSDEFDGREGWDLQLIPGIGLSAEVPGLQDFLGLGATSMMAEFQGIGFFSVNRLLVGLQFGL